jgi:nucleotide-binding universal stress UspA family protein
VVAHSRQSKSKYGFKICGDISEADPIVIGTHSEKGLQAAIGSTATGVSNNAKCDVTLFRI